MNKTCYQSLLLVVLNLLSFSINAFSFQGGMILDILPESNNKADTTLTGKLGFGRSMTSHNVFVSSTPGIHVSAGYFFPGFEIPVTGPDMFENCATFIYIRGL